MHFVFHYFGNYRSAPPLEFVICVLKTPFGKKTPPFSSPPNKKGVEEVKLTLLYYPVQ